MAEIICYLHFDYMFLIETTRSLSERRKAMWNMKKNTLENQRSCCLKCAWEKFASKNHVDENGSVMIFISRLVVLRCCFFFFFLKFKRTYFGISYLFFQYLLEGFMLTKEAIIIYPKKQIV